VTEARATLPDVIDRVLAGEEVTLTRHGQPVAVVVRPDALRPRRAEAALAAADRLHSLLEQAAESTLLARPRLSADHADEIVSSVRAGRVRR
jgi:antitoxin (DNA-binding transcriptional repressor) of toxin-antitoxin stability system